MVKLRKLRLRRFHHRTCGTDVKFSSKNKAQKTVRCPGCGHRVKITFKQRAVSKY